MAKYLLLYGLFASNNPFIQWVSAIVLALVLSIVVLMILLIVMD